MSLQTWIIATVSALSASFANAQAINLDWGTVDRPSTAYGAASGQTGWWTSPSDPQILDINQNPIGLTFSSHDMGETSTTLSGASPDDHALMNDYLFGITNADFVIYGLKPGPYRLYMYMWDIHAESERLQVVGYGSVKTTSTGVWPGSQVKGATYQTIDVNVTDVIQVVVTSDRAYWQGLQIVPIPAPGSAAIALASAGIFMRRRR